MCATLSLSGFGVLGLGVLRAWLGRVQFFFLGVLRAWLGRVLCSLCLQNVFSPLTSLSRSGLGYVDSDAKKKKIFAGIKAACL